MKCGGIIWIGNSFLTLKPKKYFGTTVICFPGSDNQQAHQAYELGEIMATDAFFKI